MDVAMGTLVTEELIFGPDIVTYGAKSKSQHRMRCDLLLTKK